MPKAAVDPCEREVLLSPRLQVKRSIQYSPCLLPHRIRGVCAAVLAMTWRELCHTGSAIEYFTWLSAKLDSIEAMPSSRVSLFFRNAS